MKLLFIAFLMIGSLWFSACSKHQAPASSGYTTVIFERPTAPAQLALQNGLTSYDFNAPPIVTGVMIYAVKNGGSDSTEFQETLLIPPSEAASQSESTVRMTLPNGRYRFYALGYSDVTFYTPVGFRCGSTQPMSLDGKNITVSIPVSDSNCIRQREFAASRFIYTSVTPNVIGSLNIVSCSPGNIPASCGGGCVACANGNAGSYKISLVGFSRRGSEITEKSDTITSTCWDTLTVPGGFNVFMSLPYGTDKTTGDSPFRLAIDVYTPSTNGSCSGTPNRRYTFPDGVYDALTGPKFYGGGRAQLFENNNDGVGVLFMED